MTRVIRAKKYQTGMVLANGGYATHQEAVCLSSKPRKDGGTYPESRPLPEHLDSIDASMIAFDQVVGPAVIEVREIHSQPGKLMLTAADIYRGLRS